MNWLTEYDPEPTWYFILLHIVTAISTFTYIFGVVCIVKIPSAVDDPKYKKLLLLNLTLNYIMQIVVTVGSMPVFMPPMFGGASRGIFENLGITACPSANIVVTVCAVSIMTTFFLFLYRYSSLSPVSRQKLIGAISVCLIAGIIFPSLLFGGVCAYVEEEEIKRNHEMRYPVIRNQIPDFWNQTVLFIELDILACVFLAYMVILLIILAVITFIIIFRMQNHLKSCVLPVTSRKMHRNLVSSLYIQSIIHYTLLVIPVVLVCLICVFEISLPGLVNVCIIIFTLSDSASVIAMLFSHRTYRTKILTTLGIKKKKITYVNTTGGTNSGYSQPVIRTNRKPYLGHY